MNNKNIVEFYDRINLLSILEKVIFLVLSFIFFLNHRTLLQHHFILNFQKLYFQSGRSPILFEAKDLTGRFYPLLSLTYNSNKNSAKIEKTKTFKIYFSVDMKKKSNSQGK